MSTEMIDALESMRLMMNNTPSSEYTPMPEKYIKLITGMSEKFTESNRFGGIQYLADFDNKYSISIIKHSGSYGREEDKWEIAVLHNGELCYDSPVTDDVIGWLTDEEVIEYFFKVKFLPEE